MLVYHFQLLKFSFQTLTTSLTFFLQAVGASHCNLMFFTKRLIFGVHVVVIWQRRLWHYFQPFSFIFTLQTQIAAANQYDFWFDRALGAMLSEANDWSAAVDGLPRQMPLLPHGPHGTIFKARLKTPLNHPSLPPNLSVNSKPAVTHTSSTRVGPVFEVSKPCLSHPPDHSPSSYTSH